MRTHVSTGKQRRRDLGERQVLGLWRNPSTAHMKLEDIERLLNSVAFPVARTLIRAIASYLTRTRRSDLVILNRQ